MIGRFVLTFTKLRYICFESNGTGGAQHESNGILESFFRENTIA